MEEDLRYFNSLLFTVLFWELKDFLKFGQKIKDRSDAEKYIQIQHR